ncbi:AAA family ATPase [Microbacterium paulum]|nr:P-loop NTPase [Microbacterium sp.]
MSAAGVAPRGSGDRSPAVARAIVAVAGERGDELAADLCDAGADVRLVVDPDAPAAAAVDAMSGREAAELLGELARADLLVLDADRRTLTAQLVAACDRFGIRIVALCAGAPERRLAGVFGVDACDEHAAAVDVLASGKAAGGAESEAEPSRGRVIAVWGAAGAPGRTTTAIELACELARDGRRVALVDADAHAPSVAMATGLADEGPGFAAACRQAERGTLTAAELTRIAAPLGPVEVLTGINRPGRWPELAHDRVQAALERCRDWADDIVVDVASSLERDEEIVSDLGGPRRNAATLAALASADLIVAVVSADPIGVARFVRAHVDLRSVVGATPVKIVVNKSRTGPVGLDARAQVRRTLERYTDAREVWFLPWDPKAADAAMLAAQPVAHVAARSALAGAVRRFVGEAIEPPVPVRRGGRDGRGEQRPARNGRDRGNRRRTVEGRDAGRRSALLPGRRARTA